MAVIVQHCVYACKGGTIVYVGGPGGLYYTSPIDSNNAIDNGDNSLLAGGTSGFVFEAVSGGITPATAAIDGGVFYGITTGTTVYSSGNGRLVVTVSYSVQELF